MVLLQGLHRLFGDFSAPETGSGALGSRVLGLDCHLGIEPTRPIILYTIWGGTAIALTSPMT